MNTIKKQRVYGIRAVSHYQGSTPGPVLMTFASQAEAERVRYAVSSCSMGCGGGRRAGQYSTGQCFEVVPTSREVGYRHEACPDDIIEAATGEAR